MKKLYFGVLTCFVGASLVACNNESVSSTAEVTYEDEQEEVEENDQDGIDHHGELPYEWAASYELEEGTYTLVFHENEHGDERFLVGFVMENRNIEDLEHHVAHIMDEFDGELVGVGEPFEARHEFANNLALNLEGSTTFTFTISESGTYRIFTEHHAQEFKMQILNESGDEVVGTNAEEYEGHGHDHSH